MAIGVPIHRSNRPQSRWRSLLGIPAVSLLVALPVLTHCARHPGRGIAVLPHPLSEDGETVVLAESIQTSLLPSGSAPRRFIPMDSMFRVARKDSIQSVTELLDLGERTGVHCIVVVADGQDKRISLLDVGRRSVTELSVPKGSERLPGELVAELSRCSGNRCETEVHPILPPEHREEYGTARLEEMLGHPDAARALYRSLIQEDSTQTLFLNGLARIALSEGFLRKTAGDFAEGSYEEAMEWLERSIRLDQENFEAHRLFGEMGVQLGRWNRAGYYLRRALRLRGTRDETYVLLSRLHPSRRRMPGLGNRRSLLWKAVTINPLNETAWIALGDAYYSMNKTKRAEEVYRQLLTIRPSSLDGLLALGKLYTYRNDVLNIVRVYERVLALDPENRDAYYNLGIAYFNDQEADQALRFFERAAALGHVDSHFYLGILHAEEGDRERAIAYFRERIRLRQRPDEPFAEEAKRSLQELLRQDGEIQP